MALIQFILPKYRKIDNQLRPIERREVMFYFQNLYKFPNDFLPFRTWEKQKPTTKYEKVGDRLGPMRAGMLCSASRHPL